MMNWISELVTNWTKLLLWALLIILLYLIPAKIAMDLKNSDEYYPEDLYLQSYPTYRGGM